MRLKIPLVGNIKKFHIEIIEDIKKHKISIIKRLHEIIPEYKVIKKPKQGVIITDNAIYTGMIIEEWKNGRIIKTPFGKGKLEFTDNSGKVWEGRWNTFKEFSGKRKKFGKEY